MKPSLSAFPPNRRGKVESTDSEYPELMVDPKTEVKMKAEIKKIEKQLESMKDENQRHELLKKLPKIRYSAL